MKRIVNILLVDDQAENLLALEGVLRGPDRKIFKALNGIAALELLIQHEFGLAIIDVHMPELSGFALAELMRNSDDTQSIPIIFVNAGREDDLTTFKGFEVGAVDFLQKPLNEHITKSKVSVFLDLFRQKKLLKEQVSALELTRLELEKSKAHLSTSNAELERFAYVASHDMKEPLRTIISYLSLISRECRGKLSAEVDEYIGFTISSAERLSHLLDSLMQLSKIGHGGLEISNVDFGGLVKEILEDLGPQIEQLNASVQVGALPTIQADGNLMRQLLQNLISNSLKYIGARPPEIQINCEKTGANWLFTVKDNGIGIAEKDFERIFKSFVRGHSKHDYPGAGIGLSICRSIIEKHGGKIWVKSEKGSGSQFQFVVPDPLVLGH